MRANERVEHCDDEGAWISSKAFAVYAEADLDRWRQLIGRQVQHLDPRWGHGTVEAVTWGSPCEHVSAFVQVSIAYEAGWTVILHSQTWHEHHKCVFVPTHVETAIRRCLDPSLSDDEQAECLSRHSRDLRDRHDREALDRLAKKRVKAREQDESTEGDDHVGLAV